jgi:hypothetical protein
MRLWRRSEAPIGGWYYLFEDGERVPRAGVATGLEPLITAVVNRLEAREEEVPEYISELIEDQICTRQPPEKCRYTKSAGDQLAKAISLAAAGIDSVLGTNLQKTARRCGSCGKRRVRMNQLSR